MSEPIQKPYPDMAYQINDKDSTVFVNRSIGEGDTTLCVVFFPGCEVSSVPDNRFNARMWHKIEKVGVKHLTRAEFSEVYETRKSKYEGLNGTIADWVKFIEQPEQLSIEQEGE